jgi:hypothetical protein
MNGWIKIHRSLLDWEWYTDTNTFRVFFHLLLVSNNKPKKWRGLSLPAGSYVSSLELLAAACGLSVRSLRTSLTKLETTSEVTRKTSNKGTIFQVVNYEKYQGATNQTTNERQTSDKPTTTIKEGKKEKKEEYKGFGTKWMTEAEYMKLQELWSIKQIDDKILAAEEWKKNTTIKSLYLTIRGWLRRDHPDGNRTDIDYMNQFTSV